MPDCTTHYQEWEKKYEEWQACDKELSRAKRDYWKALAKAELACPAAVATAKTIVGGLLLGGACLISLWDLWDAGDDLGDKFKECGGKAAASNSQGDTYNGCISNHKNN